LLLRKVEQTLHQTEGSFGGQVNTEASKALDIIQASIGNDGLTRIEPFSTIEIEFTSDNAEG
jgi:hypothetical protein